MNRERQLVLNQSIVECSSEADAIQLISDDSQVFRQLSEVLRDNEAVSLVATSKDLRNMQFASPRIRKNLAFFVQVLNVQKYPAAYSGDFTVALTSAHDLVFVADFAKTFLFCDHDISEEEICNHFWCTQKQRFSECHLAYCLNAAAPDSVRPFVSKEESIKYLAQKVPSFARFSYEFAFMRAYQWLSISRCPYGSI